MGVGEKDPGDLLMYVTAEIAGRVPGDLKEAGLHSAAINGSNRKK